MSATGDPKADEQASSTALAITKRLAPIVAVVCIVCTVAGAAALAYSAEWLLLKRGTGLRWGLWPLALILWGLLVGSNLRYWVTHRKLSVGMIPPAIMSLAPSMAAAIYFVYLDLPMPLRWTCWILMIVALLLMAVFAVYFLQVRVVYARRPAVEDDAIIIVLGGTIRNGRPCATLLLRLDEASRLWQASHGHTFVVTGGPVRDDTLCEADYMAQALVASGIPAGRILLERRARNTAENMRNSLDLLAERDVKGQLCVLTSDYHLHRALREGRRCGVELVPIASPTPPNSRLQQWSQEVLALLAAVFTH